MLRDIKNHFEPEKEEENYHKPVIVNHFWSKSYIEYESNCDRNTTLSVEKYLNKIRSYLKGITIDLKPSDARKIQLTIANNFIPTTANGEKCVMHSKSGNIEIVISHKADEVMKGLLINLK